MLLPWFRHDLSDVAPWKHVRALLPAILITSHSWAPGFFKNIRNLPAQVQMGLRKLFKFLNVFDAVIIDAIGKSAKNVELVLHQVAEFEKIRW